MHIIIQSVGPSSTHTRTHNILSASLFLYEQMCIQKIHNIYLLRFIVHKFLLLLFAHIDSYVYINLYCTMHMCWPLFCYFLFITFRLVCSIMHARKNLAMRFETKKPRQNKKNITTNMEYNKINYKRNDAKRSKREDTAKIASSLCVCNEYSFFYSSVNFRFSFTSQHIRWWFFFVLYCMRSLRRELSTTN